MGFLFLRLNLLCILLRQARKDSRDGKARYNELFGYPRFHQ